VDLLLKSNKLKMLTVRGSQFKHMTAYLISPTPDDKGPGTQVLENLILQHRQIDLPSP
jgi:hypothetical protein